MVLNSAIAIYYYTKLIVYMFLKDPITTDKNICASNNSMPLKIVAGIAFVVTTTSILTIDPLLQMILGYVSSSGY